MKVTTTALSLLIALTWFIALPIEVLSAAEVRFDEEEPRLAFAAEELRSALRDTGWADREGSVSLEILPAGGSSAGAGLRPEGFRILRNQTEIRVLGADSAGAMYGGLEVAEQIRIFGIGRVQPQIQNAHQSFRGTKFNIPLDVRTPSYSDVSDAAQASIGEMWNFDFWKEYIDTLARFRYNFISFWNLHPFPSLVKVPDYPEVALDDVRRSTVAWKEHYELTATGFDAPEIVDNYETLIEIPIEEKIAFWQRVMAYARDRNVAIYFVTWNIFVNGTEGKYGITDAIDNPTTIDYFRKSVAAMYATYPDLAGIGLTTGENMHGANFEEKEDWAFQTYGLGTLDAAQAEPKRPMTLIHRQHQTGADLIAERFQPLLDQSNIEFVFSFKYAKAHVYSSTTQPYHREFVDDIGKLKTLWTLRNDDTFLFRWGAPSFVREFLQNIPHEVSRGIYFGSDQYVWGREFLSKDPTEPRELELSKHWYQWMMWGRLGYNPNLEDGRFKDLLRLRFPGVSASELFEAWENASMVYPLVTGFHWGALDFQWYIEACLSRPSFARTPTGFHDINRFITLPPHPSVNAVSIPEYVAARQQGRAVDGLTPDEAATSMDRRADRALKQVETIDSSGNRELRQTLDDIVTVAHLGKYYAAKIRAATALALFRATGDLAQRDNAASKLNAAVYHFRQYVGLANGSYRNPFWTNRVGHVDWAELLEAAFYDLELCGFETDIPSMETMGDGRILEAEESAFPEKSRVATEIKGFTGNGYLDNTRFGPEKVELRWIFDATEAGRYWIAVRYSMPFQADHDSELKVNGKSSASFRHFRNGTRASWAWTRELVDLEAGKNEVALQAPGHLFIDHISISQAY